MMSGHSVDVWAKLAAPLPADAVQWRQDGRPVTKAGKFYARFVAYIDAHFVRSRLDACVPGEWDLTLEALRSEGATANADGEATTAFKARLQVLGVIREDVGEGSDYKQAATDAFKRAAVRFGIGAELYDYEPNWVQIDGDGKYAKPLEDPGTVYARKNGPPTRTPAVSDGERAQAPVRARTTDAPAAVSQTAGPQPASFPGGDPPCPKCGGRMWDNRTTKTNPKAPDYKCRDKTCDGVVWPPRGDSTGNNAPDARAADGAPEWMNEEDSLPF